MNIFDISFSINSLFCMCHCRIGIGHREHLWLGTVDFGWYVIMRSILDNTSFEVHNITRGPRALMRSRDIVKTIVTN